MNTQLRAALGVAAAALLVLVTGAAGGSTPTVVPRSAQSLGTAPNSVTGVADAKKLETGAPVPDCAAVQGVQWYTVRAPHRGPMVAHLIAHGQLDAALAVYRVVRSHRSSVLCAKTNLHGGARLAWYAYAEGSYLIGVARRAGSVVGGYELQVLAADQRPLPPGSPLPAGGVRDTLNPALDALDAWAVPMERGTTYRLNLTSSSQTTCLRYELFRPGATSFARGHTVLTRSCGGYAVFTPGEDGGGIYSLLVRAGKGEPVDHSYRVEVAAAEPDDAAPGIKLDNGQLVAGSLAGYSVDTVDLYRFLVPRDDELTTLELHQKQKVGFNLLVLDETGAHVAAVRGARGPQTLRLHIPAGRYFAALRAPGAENGPYTLQVRVRDVTTTSLTVNGADSLETPPATAVPLNVNVTAASHGGRVSVEIDQFDPLFGWHYDSTVTGEVSSTGSITIPWTPPSVGIWRARAHFVPNPYSSYSRSGYVRVHVIEPLE